MFEFLQCILFIVFCTVFNVDPVTMISIKHNNIIILIHEAVLMGRTTLSCKPSLAQTRAQIK